MRQDQADLDHRDDEPSDELDRRLRAMVICVTAIPGVGVEVRRRVAVAAAPRLRRWPLIFGIAGIVTAACVMGGVFLMPVPAPRPHDPPVANAATQGPQLQLGEVVIAQRLAAVIDSRAVLVCWSCRGGHPVGARRLTAPQPGVPRGNYVEVPVRREWLGGQTVSWSLFIAREHGAERDSPPTLLVEGDGEDIAFGASPKRYAPDELAFAVASASPKGGEALSMAEIRRLVVEYEKPDGAHTR